MTTTEPQPAESKGKRRWFRISQRKLLVLTLLFVVSGIGFALWSLGLPLSWTADYDKDRYTEIRRAIEADPQHLLGKSLDEVTKTFGLENVPWDESYSFQAPPGENRIYHFRGFALYVFLSGVTPHNEYQSSSTGADLQRHGVRLEHFRPYVRIDGISDGKERMKRYWKALDEVFKRLNAEMEQKRQKRQNGGR